MSNWVRDGICRRRLCSDIVAQPTDVDSNFISYPAPLCLLQFCPKM